MTDRRRLTGRQTFVKRVISLSTARWFFSLLSEQWWRERSADGVVTDFRVMQVRKFGVARRLLDENFSGLWDVVVVEELGLITSERRCWPKARLLIHGSAQGVLFETILTEEEVKDQESEVEDGRDCENHKMQSRREVKHTSAWHMDGMTRNNTFGQCRVRHYHECGQTREKMTCEGVLFTLPVGCSRLPSAVNDLATTFFLKKKMGSTNLDSTATMKRWK